MTTHTSFEYYSTFAPVTDPLLTEDFVRSFEDVQEAILPLAFIDSGYRVFSNPAYVIKTNNKASHT